MQSTTQGHEKSTNIKYETYYDLLINACARYDKTHKANLGKRSNIYTTFTPNVENTPDDDPFSSENPWESSLSTQTHHTFQGLLGTPRSNNPTHSMTLMLNLHQKPQKRQWDGPVYLPKYIYVLMNEESKEALKKYNIETLQKY